jgi:hypothetical protein
MELLTRFAGRRKSFPAERIYLTRDISSGSGVETRTGYSIDENTRHALWPPKPKLFFMALRIFMARGWNGT